MRDGDGEDKVRRYEEEVHVAEFGEAELRRRGKFRRLAFGFLLLVAAVFILAMFVAWW
jgi:hypothetical protein